MHYQCVAFVFTCLTTSYAPSIGSLALRGKNMITLVLQLTGK